MEQIDELIKNCKKRLSHLRDMDIYSDNISHIRYAAKIECYHSFITDLERLKQNIQETESKNVYK